MFVDIWMVTVQILKSIFDLALSEMMNDFISRLPVACLFKFILTPSMTAIKIIFFM